MKHAGPHAWMPVFQTLAATLVTIPQDRGWTRRMRRPDIVRHRMLTTGLLPTWPKALFGLLLTFPLIAFNPVLAADDVLRVGSKRFTESYILGEIVRQSAAPHARVEHLQGLGNTAILFEALKAGSIDVYPEYLGTIDLEILKHEKPGTLADINRALAPMGLGAAVPLGFNNTYALAMRDSGATDGAGVPARLSDLSSRPRLKFGLSHEFIGRADGWPGLSKRYALPQNPRGLDHGIAYEALRAGQVDLIDIYSTDAKIARLGLRVLEDDLGYFPRYDAVLLYRLDAARRFAPAWNAVVALEGRIDEAAMIAMNGAAELDGKSFSTVAREFLQPNRAGPSPAQPAAASAAGGTGTDTTGAGPRAAAENTKSATTSRPGLMAKIFDENLSRLTRQHLTLVLLSLLVATAIGIPLGMAAASRTSTRQAVLAAVGILQTIPSLALLAMLIPILGMIGTVPALVALCLYALLPIVRNTCTGLLQVSPGIRQAALALGLRRRQQLWLIELPLAMPVIAAGIKTAAVMSVGTATIAAFIGAGGYGERIAIGLALNDNDMLLAGAIPAAVLALLTQAVFEGVEWLLLRRRGAT
jgi:osmoprotectant transport system permease protein